MDRVFKIDNSFQVPDGTILSPFLNPKDAFSDLPWDLFEGFSHIESDNPLNVVVTRYEEGFPFIAMSYMHRINDEFKELYAHDKSVMGHIMANMDNVLPLLLSGCRKQTPGRESVLICR